MAEVPTTKTRTPEMQVADTLQGNEMIACVQLMKDRRLDPNMLLAFMEAKARVTGGKTWTPSIIVSQQVPPFANAINISAETLTQPDDYSLHITNGSGAVFSDAAFTADGTIRGMYFSLPAPPPVGNSPITIYAGLAKPDSSNPSNPAIASAAVAITGQDGAWSMNALGDFMTGGSALQEVVPINWTAGSKYFIGFNTAGTYGTCYFYTPDDVNNPLRTFALTSALAAMPDSQVLFLSANDAQASITSSQEAIYSNTVQISTSQNIVDPASYPASRAGKVYAISGMAGTFDTPQGTLENGNIAVFAADESLLAILGSQPPVTHPPAPSVEEGSNAFGKWQKWYNENGDESMVIQTFSGISSTGGNVTVNLPTNMPDEKFEARGNTESSARYVAIPPVAQTASTVDVGTWALATGSRTAEAFSGIAIWIREP